MLTPRPTAAFWPSCSHPPGFGRVRKRRGRIKNRSFQRRWEGCVFAGGFFRVCFLASARRCACEITLIFPPTIPNIAKNGRKLTFLSSHRTSLDGRVVCKPGGWLLLQCIRRWRTTFFDHPSGRKVSGRVAGRKKRRFSAALERWKLRSQVSACVCADVCACAEHKKPYDPSILPKEPNQRGILSLSLSDLIFGKGNRDGRS